MASPAAGPQWWIDRGVIDSSATPNNYGPVNLGQLKAMATAAYDEMEQDLPGGAGADVTTLVKSWYQLELDGSFHLVGGKRVPLTGPTTDNFAAANLGQMKAVAKPFYDQLMAIGYSDQYPWNGSDADAPDNFALANIGQLKNVFNFDLAAYLNPAQAPISVSGAWDGGAEVVSWTAGGANQTGFVIRRSTDGVNWVTIGTVAGNMTSLVDNGASEGESYQYDVSAVNGAGSSSAAGSGVVVASFDIPMLPYAAIQISSDDDPQAQGMALGDDGAAAYWYQNADGSYTAVSWTNGATERNTFPGSFNISFPVGNGVTSPGVTSPSYSFSAADDTPAVIAATLGVKGISADGTLAANACASSHVDKFPNAVGVTSNALPDGGGSWEPFSDQAGLESVLGSSIKASTPGGGPWGHGMGGGVPCPLTSIPGDQQAFGDFPLPTQNVTVLAAPGALFPRQTTPLNGITATYDNSTNTVDMKIVTNWEYGALEPVSTANFNQFALSYSGTCAVGNYRAPIVNPDTCHAYAAPDTLSMFGTGIIPQLASSSTLSLWDGIGAGTMVALNDPNATIYGVDDYGTMVGSFPSIGGQIGIISTFGDPSPISSLIDQDYVQRVTFNSVVSVSSDGKILLNASILQSGSGTATDGQVIFDAYTHELFVVQASGFQAQYINSDKMLGCLQDGSVFVFVPVQVTQNLTDEEVLEDGGSLQTSSLAMAVSLSAAKASTTASADPHAKKITLTNAGGNVGDAGTAFIYATAASDGGPVMPDLSSTMNGVGTKVSALWKLEAKFTNRPSDDVLVPPGGGWVGKPVGEPWDMPSFYPPSFFGGDNTVLTFQVLKDDGSPAGAQTTAKFQILGKNPPAEVAANYISSIAAPLNFPYAWGIAKWESHDTSNHPWYNQFANGKSDGSPGAHGAKGWPFYAAEEKNGWGMFQRDPSGGGIPLTLGQLWNWHENVKVAVQQELVEKRNIARNYLMTVGPNPPTYTTRNGKVFEAVEVLTMERYNGANGRSNSHLLVYSPKNPDGVGVGKRWEWRLPPAPRQPAPYVDMVASVMTSYP